MLNAGCWVLDAGFRKKIIPRILHKSEVFIRKIHANWGGENRRVYRRNFNPPPNFGGLIPFLFHILRFQVSGVRNDEQRRCYLKPDT